MLNPELVDVVFTAKVRMAVPYDPNLRGSQEQIIEHQLRTFLANTQCLQEMVVDSIEFHGKDSAKQLELDVA